MRIFSISMFVKEESNFYRSRFTEVDESGGGHVRRAIMEGNKHSKSGVIVGTPVKCFATP
ncbi:hypothetical protein KSC_049610 [Ktedonobacter sp. SOSP1-52]|nr:hypothetical protein KSC_049610 [Ktedonobacter sp. SOSP1-52]